MNANNIICCKWGTLYGPEFVNRLYGMVKKNLTLPFRFICLTDNATGIREEVETFPIEPHLRGWWPKIQYFKSSLFDIEGPILALDLDILIVNNIDCFFEYKPTQFCMKPDFPGKGYGGFTTSVMRFNAGKHSHIYENFDINKLDVFIHNGEPGFASGGRKKKYWGDQIWVTEQMNGKIIGWPKEWITKWKHKWTMYGIDTLPGKIIDWTGYMKDQRIVYDKIKHIWCE